MTLAIDRPDLLQPVVDDGTRRELLAAGLLLGLGLAGCGDDADEPARPARQGFTDSVGRRVDIPTRPRRIVSLHEPTSGAALLSVGAPVIGMVKDPELPYRPYDHSRIRGVGTFAEPDLETIAALRPDLIVAYSAGGKLFPEDVRIDKLQRIAPTIAFAEDVPVDRYMAAVAAISGLDDEVARQRSAYERDLADLRAAVPHASDLTVVVAGGSDSGAYVFAANNPTPSAAIPLAIGARPATVAQRKSADGSYVMLSAERLADIRADVILYDSFGKQITDLALWDRLPAVRAGQAHLVPTMYGASYANYRRMIAPLREVLQGAMALGSSTAGARSRSSR